MAKIQLTEEEANSKYQEGYNDGRHGSESDIVDGLEEVVGGFVDMIFDIGKVSVSAMSFGVLDFDSDEEKEERLQEIYDAGYEQGVKDREAYDSDK